MLNISLLVKIALDEDLAQDGDITTSTLIPADLAGQASFTARKEGVIAGLEIAQETFRQLDPAVEFTPHIQDGDKVKAGTAIATVKGKTRSLLIGERAALNFLCHLSGIATATRELVDLVSGTYAKITDTRKTTPGLRALEKYAVRMGGGVNHRFGLYDAVLIKDNHIAALNGDVEQAARRAKNSVPEGTPIIVEVDNLSQIGPAIAGGATRLLLDNMMPEQLQKAVQQINSRALTEASGTISKDTIRAIAETGVDYISVGRITHSAPILDIGLDWA